MLRPLLFFPAFVLLFSCNTVNRNANVDPSEKKLMKEAVSAGEGYVRGQLGKAKKTVSKDGLIVLSDPDSKYLIDPSRIVTGEIDDDSVRDAIVPVYLFRNQNLISTEHLFLINKNGRLTIATSVISDMKVLSVKDRIIFVEVPNVARDSPNFGCGICKDVVKYKYSGDSLSVVE